MQANCPNCSQRIVIDDAKVPDRPFKVKCPKCQSSVSLPGKGASPMPNAPPEAAPLPPPAATSPAEEMRSQMMAQLRREIGHGEGGASAGRALVSLPDRGMAGAITVTLTRLGYQVDNIEDPDEGAHLVEQGIYTLVATTRSAAAGPRGENLYQRTNRLSPDNRRRIFLALVGDEYKSGDGTQAWTTVADLVLNGRDVGNADAILHNTFAERARLYQVFLDARRRFEQAAG